MALIANVCQIKGLDGAVIAMQSFGASASAEQLFEKYGFTTENIVNVVKKLHN